MTVEYDAIIVVSFGGPEGPDEVIPFLENVLRGRNVPRERMLEVAEHYYHFGGVSPINAQNRSLIAALEQEMSLRGWSLPVYWGNRNWHPLLTDTLRQMRDDGVRRGLAFVTSAYSSYSSCRQYLDDIARARTEVGATAPDIDKIRPFFNHPSFLEGATETVREALHKTDRPRSQTPLLFTAHSIPIAMAQNCAYVSQLQEVAQHVAGRVGNANWQLVYQSRSGPPSQPWLEPDIADALRELHSQGKTDVVVAPIGFLSDHMEVLYDLDTEARQLCDRLGINMVRAATVASTSRFVTMVCSLIEERIGIRADRAARGSLGPCPDVCPDGCCPSGRPAAFGESQSG